MASAGGLIERDVRNVWTSMRTRAQMLVDRHAGQLPLLAVRELSVGYDGVTVLADVAIEVGEGEIVALLGTNGAGKSTLLRAIGGVVEADHGAIVFDGRDITHLPPDEIARLGIAQVPGGEGIFPNLRVRGEPARRGLAGPATGRARRRHDRRGARPPSRPWPPAATSGPATSRAASSRCSPSPWRPSPAPSCS